MTVDSQLIYDVGIVWFQYWELNLGPHTCLASASLLIQPSLSGFEGGVRHSIPDSWQMPAAV